MRNSATVIICPSVIRTPTPDSGKRSLIDIHSIPLPHLLNEIHPYCVLPLMDQELRQLPNLSVPNRLVIQFHARCNRVRSAGKKRLVRRHYIVWFDIPFFTVNSVSLAQIHDIPTGDSSKTVATFRRNDGSLFNNKKIRASSFGDKSLIVKQ